MAVSSKAHTTWSGDLPSGSGHTSLASSGVADFDINWNSRSAGGGSAVTPEELLAAAHSSCFAMALSHALGENGTPPTDLAVDAEVVFVPGEGVKSSALTLVATVPGLSAEEFAKFADDAKDGCPVSQALAGIDISLESVTFN
ncbi:OsmC family peroxiredoxin [Demequina aurantiaca]|uniref:OsmC family peroxiredoxin n=1 Tax=Demequina aurantiaca TaxID=676200 RepID=UPI000783776C|nr:OsmC family peroxiredoxin [Demequina aurantiaca]